MTKITIPREALKAAARAIEEADKRAIEEADIGMLPSYEEAAHAACLAMLKNWPGAWQTVSRQGVLTSRTAPPAFIDVPQIILPLPKEPSDD